MKTTEFAAAAVTVNEITPYEAERIEYRVHALGRAFRLRPHATDDLRQDFSLALLRAKRRYDPEQSSPETFANRSLDKSYCYFARRIRAEQSRGVVSVGDCEFIACAGRDWRGNADERMDLEGALQRLPRKLRDTAEELKVYTPREVAERMHVHRSTIYRRVAQIKAYLIAYGIDDAV